MYGSITMAASIARLPNAVIMSGKLSGVYSMSSQVRPPFSSALATSTSVELPFDVVAIVSPFRSG
jgi:hypothetical protein